MPAHGIPFGEALRVWARVAALSFGGPAGQIAVMHRILVEEKRWIGESRFLHALNYCMLLPGPEAQQLAIYIGWLLHRTRAAWSPARCSCCRASLAIMALSWLYAAFGKVGAGRGAVLRPEGRGARDRARGGAADRPAGAQEPASWSALAAAAFVAIFFFDVPFPLIVLGAGADRLARRARRPRGVPSPAAATARSAGAQVADADSRARRATCRRTRGRRSPGRCKVAAICLVLWLAPVAAARC